MVDAERAVSGLRELAHLTSDHRGAQRVAWTATWVAARTWLRSELDLIAGVSVETDQAFRVAGGSRRGSASSAASEHSSSSVGLLGVV
jgi:hypothetical protein